MINRDSSSGFSALKKYSLLGSMIFCIAVIASVLIYSQGLPYVTDGNESFSAYTHAKNLRQWGPRLAMGLTDEATADVRAGHPYIYTHQGNFPRLFSLVLLVLGIDAIEWHIVLAALIVGGVSAYLCYTLFSQVADTLFACTVCAVLWTDYILFVQWQVNSYRVWHSLFLFASLLCVRTITEANKTRISFLLFLNSLALFYFEYVFATFVLLFSVAYALIVYRKHLNRMLWVSAATLAGGIASVVLFVVQVFAHLGPERAMQDFKLVYFARNFAGDIAAADLRASIMQFYLDNKIVFWDVFDTANYYSVASFLKSVGPPVLQVYSPFFVLLTGIVMLGTLLSGIAYKSAPPRNGTPFRDRGERSGKLTVLHLGSFLWKWAALAAGFYMIGGMLVESMSSQFRIAVPNGVHVFSAIGFANGLSGPISLVRLASAVAFAGLMTRVLTGKLLRTNEIPAMRLGLVVGFVGLVATLMLRHRHLYDLRAIALWYWFAQSFWPMRVLQGILLVAFILGVCFVVGCSDRYLWQPRGKSFVGILQYLAAGSSAFLGVYALFPGYLNTGYLQRYAPLPVFVSDVAIAMFFYLMVTLVQAGGRDLRTWYAQQFKARVQTGTSPHMPSIAPAMLLCVLSTLVGLFASFYWIRLQAAYVSNLPPTALLFMKRLGDPAFKRASFVSNNYALPVAYFTQRWAYQDHVLGEDKSRATKDGNRIEISGKYVWFADRETNREYVRPQYYLCRINPTLDTVAELVTLPPGRRLTNCSAEAIFQHAWSGDSRPFRHTIVDYDRGKLDGWSIIKLDVRTELSPLWTSLRR